MIGISLVEDLAVVALTVLMPAMGALTADRLVVIGQAVGKAAVMLVPLGYLAGKVVPWLLRQVVRTGNPELFRLSVLKLLIWTLIVWLFRYGLGTALRAAVGLTQIGEFSFVLVQAARSAGHVGTDVYNATLATALVTILINALLVRWSARPTG